MKKQQISNCKGKTFFVTGGAGFIGSEVVKQISESNGRIVVFDNFMEAERQVIPRTHPFGGINVSLA